MAKPGSIVEKPAIGQAGLLFVLILLHPALGVPQTAVIPMTAKKHNVRSHVEEAAGVEARLMGLRLSQGRAVLECQDLNWQHSNNDTTALRDDACQMAFRK